MATWSYGTVVMSIANLWCLCFWHETGQAEAMKKLQKLQLASLSISRDIHTAFTAAIEVTRYPLHVSF